MQEKLVVPHVPCGRLQKSHQMKNFSKIFVTLKVQVHTKRWLLGMRESYLAICGDMLEMLKWQKMFFKQPFFRSTLNEIGSRQGDVFVRGFTRLQPIRQSMLRDGIGDIVW
jgi:hypothetical protein